MNELRWNLNQPEWKHKNILSAKCTWLKRFAKCQPFDSELHVWKLCPYDLQPYLWPLLMHWGLNKIFRCIFFNGKSCKWIKISPKIVPKQGFHTCLGDGGAVAQQYYVNSPVRAVLPCLRLYIRSSQATPPLVVSEGSCRFGVAAVKTGTGAICSRCSVSSRPTFTHCCTFVNAFNAFNFIQFPACYCLLRCKRLLRIQLTNSPG